MKFSYLELLKQAFLISWRYKFLWIFGVLAIPFSNIGILSFLSQVEAISFLNGVWVWILTTFSLTNLRDLYEASPWEFFSFWLFILLNGASTLVFIWLALLSQFVIIKKFGEDSSRNCSLISVFRGFFKKEVGLFSVFGLYVGANGLVILLSVLSMLPAFGIFWLKGFYTQTLVSSIGWTLGFLVILASVVIYFIVLFGVNYIILKKNSLKESIYKSVDLVGRNLFIAFEFLVIMLVLTWMVSYVSIIISNLSILILGIFFHIVIPSTLGVVLGTFLTIICIFAILSFLGFVTVFQFGFGTLLFISLVKGKQIGFVQSLLKKVNKKS